MVLEIKDEAQWKQVLKGDKPVLADFTAKWCGPCKQVAPIFAQMATKYPNVLFVKVDVDDLDTIAAAAGISAMPTFQVYKNGVKTTEVRGADIQQLENIANTLNKEVRLDQLMPGTQVYIQGLVSAAQHNGKQGAVVGFDSQRQRYQVRLKEPSGSEELWVKAENLLQAARVEVLGMTGDNDHYNGQKGSIQGRNENGAYQVQLDGSTVVGFNLENLILQSGTRVTIQNLSKAEYNGKSGAITDFDRQATRYVVQLSAEHCLKLRTQNIYI